MARVGCGLGDTLVSVAYAAGSPVLSSIASSYVGGTVIFAVRSGMGSRIGPGLINWLVLRGRGSGTVKVNARCMISMVEGSHQA